VTANAISPGPAQTAFGDNMRGAAGLFPKVMKRLPIFASPAKAARTPVYVASSDQLGGVTGQFYLRGKQWKAKPIARDPEVAARLWDGSEQLARIAPDRAGTPTVAEVPHP
jgi:NAD(P)-dependent dehydrogenase (short-subunit alcohol dehydrogenase family)